MLKVKKLDTDHPDYVFYKGDEEVGRAIKVPNIPKKNKSWMVWYWYQGQQRDSWYQTQEEAFNFIKLGMAKLEVRQPNIKHEHYHFFHENEVVGVVYRMSWGRWYARETSRMHHPSVRFFNQKRAFAYIRNQFEQRKLKESSNV